MQKQAPAALPALLPCMPALEAGSAGSLAWQHCAGTHAWDRTSEVAKLAQKLWHVVAGRLRRPVQSQCPAMRILACPPGAGARLSGMVTSSSPTAGRAVGRGSGGGGGAAAAAGAPRAVSVGPGSSSPAASTSLSTSSAASGAAGQGRSEQH